MREKLIALRERRALLVSRAEHQREAAFVLIQKAETATAWFDRARSMLRNVQRHPLWIVAGVALLVALRPGKAFKWFATGLSLWRTWRSVRATLDRFVPAQPPARRPA